MKKISGPVTPLPATAPPKAAQADTLRTPLPPSGPEPRPAADSLRVGTAPLANASPQLAFLGPTAIDHDGIDYDAIAATPLNAQEQAMCRAIQNYPAYAGDERKAHIIAHITRLACDHFNIDPKLALAVFAHESAFDDNASKGGGTGLGQLTKPAIEEVYEVGVKRVEAAEKDKPNYTRHRRDTQTQLAGNGVNTPDVFRRLFQRKDLAPRKDIHDNIWTSIAYLRTRMDAVSTRSDAADTRKMLAEYNNNTTDPAIKKAYPGKVAEAYRQLWGQNLPASYTNFNQR